MSVLHPDVSFPLFNGGSTAAITDRLRLRLLHLGGTTIDESWGLPDFSTPTWRAYVNLDDGVVVRWPGSRDLPLQAGHLYVLPAWLRWSGRCTGRVRHLHATFDLPNLPKERVIAVCDRVLHLGGPGTPLADAWLELGRQLMGISQPAAIHLARGYALTYEVLFAVFTQLGRAADGLISAPGEALLADTVAWIECNLEQPMSVAELAVRAHCSRAELVRRFRTAYGTSPARWIRQRRVAVAADRLRWTTDRVEDIALRCGFNDRNRFSKVFSELMGCAPATWRRTSGR